MAGLIPDFGNIALTVAAFVVALSIIVAVHEYGHYIVGRWCGIHAEVFSLGFGPRLFSRVDSRGTRWQLAALPFGGYVKFMGDSDAASRPDGAALQGLSADEARHTMQGAPLWARAATVAAGPLFNFALSILIFSGFLWVSGIARDEAVVGEVMAVPGAEALQPGDAILALDGQPVADLAAFYAVARSLPPAASTQFLIHRGGTELEVTGPYPFPPLVSGVQPMTPAAESGMQDGDFVTSVNGTPVLAFDQMREIVGNSNGAPVTLGILRGDETLEITITPRRTDLPKPEGGFETRWMVGLGGGPAILPALRTPGPIEGVSIAAAQVWGVITTSLSGLWHMAAGNISTCNLQGPLGIAETSGAAASLGAESFILFIATLSTAVGLMNLFPIPVLDGGHLLFHAWEAVTRRKPSDRVVQGLMTAGLAVLLALMAFGLSNDTVLCP
jgi:regulator of sigma E protease